MNKIYILTSFLLLTSNSLALTPKETARYFNGPTVQNISSTSANFSLSNMVLSDISQEELAQIYFEYIETNMACPAIYPTPEACLPKKTKLGLSNVTVNDLKPNTNYTVKYKKDNSIRCITTPCPGNEFESLSVEFKTKNGTENTLLQITRDLRMGMKHREVEILQKILIEQGYLEGKATGYFGALTKMAVINYQKMHNINPTGIVGKLTRATFIPAKGETFEGKVEAYSTGCFVDGICSVTVNGKVVIVTRGWARDPVGTLRGVESIGDVEKKIGHNAKVYALKTSEGYTLYGNKEFYIEIQ